MNLDFSAIKKMTVDGVDLKTLEVQFYNNLLPKSIDTDGSVFNGVGFMNGYRLNSSGVLTALDGAVVTGFIPVDEGDIIRIKGASFASSGDNHNYIRLCDKDFVGVATTNSGGYTSGDAEVIIAVDGDITSFEIKKFPSKGAAYARISMIGDGTDMRLSINEPLTDIVWEEPFTYTNQVPISINADGTIYNGVGYKNGYRVRSGGTEVEMSDGVCTGFIPFKKGDVLRIYPQFNGLNSNNAINFADATFTNLGQITDYDSSYGICSGKQSIYKTAVVDGVSMLEYSDGFDSSVAYVRITHAFRAYGTEDYVEDGSEMIVTINEEIEV